MNISNSIHITKSLKRQNLIEIKIVEYKISIIAIQGKEYEFLVVLLLITMIVLTDFTSQVTAFLIKMSLHCNAKFTS